MYCGSHRRKEYRDSMLPFACIGIRRIWRADEVNTSRCDFLMSVSGVLFAWTSVVQCLRAEDGEEARNAVRFAR